VSVKGLTEASVWEMPELQLFMQGGLWLVGVQSHSVVLLSSSSWGWLFAWCENLVAKPGLLKTVLRALLKLVLRAGIQLFEGVECGSCLGDARVVDVLQ
jgi:hypothetical protein